MLQNFGLTQFAIVALVVPPRHTVSSLFPDSMEDRKKSYTTPGKIVPAEAIRLKIWLSIFFLF